MTGLQRTDILMLRCLIDATKKLQRELRKNDVELFSIVFVRNDVYQLLMKNSADFGKEMRVLLGWSDPDQLKEMIRRRLTVSAFPADTGFQEAWQGICVPLFRGENSFDYLINRSLMRPRNIIKQVIHCKASAVNLGRGRIDADDIEKGLLAYSHDVLIEADRELSDIDPKLENFLYTLISESSELEVINLWSLLEKHGVPINQWERAVDHLFYFGFFCIRIEDLDPKYIFDYQYNIQLANAERDKFSESYKFVINPAFWPALSIRQVQ